jgi:phage terminase large subunit-like protein
MTPAASPISTYEVLPGLEWLFDDSDIPDPQGRAQRCIDFVRLLRHPKSRLPDRELRLDPWQERLIRRIYGPTDEFGNRLTRVVYLQVGKGSRKTSLSAVLSLLHLLGPERVPRAQCYAVAHNKENAEQGFNEAADIVDATPELAAVTRPVKSKLRLYHPKSGAYMMVLSSDENRGHSITPDFALVDELWAHRKIGTYQAIEGGISKIPNSLLIIATTAGAGTDSPDFPMYAYAKQVASGEVVDSSFLPVIFEAEQEDDILDEAVWHKVLPGLRHGYPDISMMRRKAAQLAFKPSDRAFFEQFFLGIRQESSANPLVPMWLYDEGKEPFSLADMKGLPCWLAIDLSRHVDMSVIAAVWKDGDKFFLWAWFYVPQNNLAEREDRTQKPMSEWTRQTFINAKGEQEPYLNASGNVVDHGAIADKIVELSQEFDVLEVMFDPALAMLITQKIEAAGVPSFDFPQRPSNMMPALMSLERALVDRKLVHGGNPVMRFCFENAEVESSRMGDSKRLVKRGEWLSIDGAVAAAMAISRASIGEESHWFDAYLADWKAQKGEAV